MALTKRVQPMGASYVLAQGRANYTAPADTNEDYAIAIPIPGGFLGTNSIVEVKLLTTHTNNANVKTVKMKLNNSATPGGTLLGTSTCTSYGAYEHQFIFRNANSLSAQEASGVNVPGGASALATATMNTANNTWIHISLTKATAGDTFTLLGYTVKVLKAPTDM